MSIFRQWCYVLNNDKEIHEDIRAIIEKYANSPYRQFSKSEALEFIWDNLSVMAKIMDKC